MRDYATAALRYEEAGLTENAIEASLSYAAQPVLHLFWLRKAVAAADLAKAINVGDRARIYSELAKALARQLRC